MVLFDIALRSTLQWALCLGIFRWLRTRRSSPDVNFLNKSGKPIPVGLADLRALCQIAGWSSMRTIQRYAVFEQSDLDEVMAKTARVKQQAA
jgi:hypothetical protein